MPPPPLGRQDSIISINSYAKSRHGPPLCNLDRGFEHRSDGRRPFFWPSPNFGPKTGLNSSEDLSFFWSSPNLGQENGLGFGLENFHSDLYNSQIPAPPPFSKILRTLLHESVLIRWIIASHLCTAVGCQQFRIESRKFQTRIMFVHYYSFFHYCLLSCRYVMFHKHILSKPKWGGAQAVVRGSTAPGPPVLTALTQPSEAMGV